MAKFSLTAKASTEEVVIAYTANGVVWGVGTDENSAREDAKKYDAPSKLLFLTTSMSAKKIDKIDGDNYLVVDGELVQLKRLGYRCVVEALDSIMPAEPTGTYVELPNGSIVLTPKASA